MSGPPGFRLEHSERRPDDEFGEFAVMEAISALAAKGHRTLPPLPAAPGQDGRRPPAWISRPEGS